MIPNRINDDESDANNSMNVSVLILSQDVALLDMLDVVDWASCFYMYMLDFSLLAIVERIHNTREYQCKADGSTWIFLTDAGDILPRHR